MIYDVAMSEAKPIPVRLNSAVIARLDRAAQRMGTNRAALIRLCVSGFLDHFLAAGGVASLPLNWREMLASMDGRSAAGHVAVINGSHNSVKQTGDAAAKKKKRKANLG